MTDNKRKFRKIVLMSEIVSIETEEFYDSDKIYSAMFNKDFSEEISFLLETKGCLPEDEQQEPKKQKLGEKFDQNYLKPLHRELAVLLHPDLNPDTKTDDFKRMQTAYEESDASVLISMAVDMNISIELDDETLDKIESNIKEKKRDLESKKDMIRWVWAASDKNHELRAEIRKALSIDESLYQAWREKNNSKT